MLKENALIHVNISCLRRRNPCGPGNGQKQPGGLYQRQLHKCTNL